MRVDAALSVAALAVSILCGAAGNLLYKLYFRERKRAYVAASIMFFVITPLTTSLALRNIGIDIVYMTASCGIVLVLLGARHFLKERLSRAQCIGVAILLIGVLIYNY